MQPTYFINHGGGPCFFLEPGPMRARCHELEVRLTAILVISGHWEEPRATVNDGATPPLLFDYSDFPAPTYELTWPAPGAPEVAARVKALLAATGIDSGSDSTRGWDHGVFVPMKVFLPDADISVVQLSLQRGLDPKAHLAIRRALRPLRTEGVLILGSGQTYHNMRGIMRGRTPVPDAEAFDGWLRAAMAHPETRNDALTV
ncbi:hypothetical protein P775_11710 [Puniceibacterium antarcticum]|uniref:Extradiol ring-cleavage dioxygenase class III enzyme subunit B domain-containing protein n=1 Tax=Puniceibacterium antarcticum TaxID=1206336 RepID=A0A2G8REL7_9RHOB|nr:class III extradiol ring-cleavage dioxygenase [Puniceibacterium antarcticum]PIL20015.1 hypothetical protein P775_11710 [Puniceibacterium antarcticum]